jgi:hypothetical protein
MDRLRPGTRATLTDDRKGERYGRGGGLLGGVGLFGAPPPQAPVATAITIPTDRQEGDRQGRLSRTTGNRGQSEGRHEGDQGEGAAMTRYQDRPQDTNAQTPEDLREQVEQTRQELGETVEALAAKSDLKARAQHRAAAVKVQAGHVATQVRDRAAHTAHTVRERTPEPVRQKAGQTVVQVRDKAAHAARTVQDKAPEPLRQRADQGARMARENRTALLAVTAGLLALALMRRRRKARR